MNHELKPFITLSFLETFKIVFNDTNGIIQFIYIWIICIIPNIKFFPGHLHITVYFLCSTFKQIQKLQNSFKVSRSCGILYLDTV